MFYKCPSNIMSSFSPEQTAVAGSHGTRKQPLMSNDEGRPSTTMHGATVSGKPSGDDQLQADQQSSTTEIVPPG
jgi:hypothetical protein